MNANPTGPSTATIGTATINDFATRRREDSVDACHECALVRDTAWSLAQLRVRRCLAALLDAITEPQRTLSASFKQRILGRFVRKLVVSLAPDGFRQVTQQPLDVVRLAR